MSIWKEKAKGLSNVIFTGWVGKKELIYLSRISKIGLMDYRKGELRRDCQIKFLNI